MNENNKNDNNLYDDSIEQIDEPIEPLDIKAAIKKLDAEKEDSFEKTAKIDDHAPEEIELVVDEQSNDKIVIAADDSIIQKKSETRLPRSVEGEDSAKKESFVSGEKVLVGATKAVGFTLKGVFKIIGKFFKVILEALMTLMLVGVISGVVVGCVFFMYIDNYFDPEYDIDGLEFNINQTTTMWYTDRDGQQVQLEEETLYGSENRTWAQYTDLPQNLVNAFVAVEDKRFFEHNGVDFRRTFSAFVNFFIPIKKN